MNISSETFELAKILSLIQEALLRGEVLMNSTQIQGEAKQWIKSTIVNRCNAMRNDMLVSLTQSDADIMRQDILSDETALQLDNVKNMFLALYKPQRDEVENYLMNMKKEAA